MIGAMQTKFDKASKAVLIVALLMSVGTYAQTKKRATKCQMTSAPILRGFFLGQTVDDINGLIPSFNRAYSNAVDSGLLSDESKEIGNVYMDSSELFYPDDNRPNVRSVPRKDFEDTDFAWHFLDKKLFVLSVKYVEFEPLNLRSFINQVAEKINLPKEGWSIEDKYHAELKCNGFAVYVDMGKSTEDSSVKAPEVMLVDMERRIELDKRRKRLAIRKKNEERERIRREREKKSIFKP
jgi:hypothetical protein